MTSNSLPLYKCKQLNHAEYGFLHSGFYLFGVCESLLAPGLLKTLGLKKFFKAFLAYLQNKN